MIISRTGARMCNGRFVEGVAGLSRLVLFGQPRRGTVGRFKVKGARDGGQRRGREEKRREKGGTERKERKGKRQVELEADGNVAVVQRLVGCGKKGGKMD